MCDCKERIVLYEPKFGMEAWEAWCPNHGYQNDCYLCDTRVGNGNFYFSTELCLRHRITPMELCQKCKDILLRGKPERGREGPEKI